MSTADASWTSFFRQALDLLYPPKCALCDLLSGDGLPCPTCRGEMVPSEPRLTIEREGDLDYRASLYEYEGRAGQAVRRLKYARSTSLVPFMAAQLFEAAEELRLVTELVIPVPIHWTRLSMRGFNQSDLLASGFATTPDALRRTRPTLPQAGLNREQRLQNLKGAFEASAEVAGKRVLLIDDVVTSGQTARECAKALRAEGAVEVGILAFAGDLDF
jgi:ComF family protein